MRGALIAAPGRAALGARSFRDARTDAPVRVPFGARIVTTMSVDRPSNPKRQFEASALTGTSAPKAVSVSTPMRDVATGAVSIPDLERSVKDLQEVLHGDELINEHMRRGGTEVDFAKLQASKPDPVQESIAHCLPELLMSDKVDVVVVGCGPAGMALAAELGRNGVAVGLVGFDMPWTNNYGVWEDEFNELGLGHCVDRVWQDATCFFGVGADAEEKRVGRAYARVDRLLLRKELVERCLKGGVKFLAGEVAEVEHAEAGDRSTVHIEGHGELHTRLVAIATGAAAGKFLKYEDGAPTVAAQTAYGIEAEIEGYPFDPTVMHFMDYRRHHTGVFPGSALNESEETHTAQVDLWGTKDEVPSFLYAMPTTPTRVFLEETCLTNRPGLPFEVLKRRLYRRMDALGIKVVEVHDEEWSYIPVGGPLPRTNQPVVAFGAAANMVHPATGYSVARSMREASGMADEIAKALKEETQVLDVSARAWDVLWSQERKRQASFHVFGMELLAILDLECINGFFTSFFSLEARMWQGFLGAELSSVDLLIFAMTFFANTSNYMRYRLMHHLFTHDSGEYMFKAYLGLNKEPEAGGEDGGEQIASA